MKELKIEVPQGYEIDKEKSTFEKIIFKKVEIKLPKTWKEYCENNPVGREYFITNCSGIVDTGGFNSNNRNSYTDQNLLNTFKDAEAHLALIQLHRLRDVYRQGWKPNWNENNNKFCISYCEGQVLINAYWHAQYFLSFQSQAIAEEFLKNFKDLIEKAKELL